MDIPLEAELLSTWNPVASLLKQACVSLYCNGLITDAQLTELFVAHPEWRSA